MCCYDKSIAIQLTTLCYLDKWPSQTPSSCSVQHIDFTTFQRSAGSSRLQAGLDGTAILLSFIEQRSRDTFRPSPSVAGATSPRCAVSETRRRSAHGHGIYSRRLFGRKQIQIKFCHQVSSKYLNIKSTITPLVISLEGNTD